MIDIALEVPAKLAAEDLTGIRTALESVARNVSAEHDVEFSEIRVLLVGEDRIRRLHFEYFDDRSATDVITFPENVSTAGEPVGGDIAICLDVARRQAAEAGHSIRREIAFLAVHGMLHLCGWLDDTTEGRERMLRVQDDLLGRYERLHGRL